MLFSFQGLQTIDMLGELILLAFYVMLFALLLASFDLHLFDEVVGESCLQLFLGEPLLGIVLVDSDFFLKVFGFPGEVKFIDKIFLGLKVFCFW